MIYVYVYTDSMQAPTERSQSAREREFETLKELVWRELDGGGGGGEGENTIRK